MSCYYSAMRGFIALSLLLAPCAALRLGRLWPFGSQAAAGSVLPDTAPPTLERLLSALRCWHLLSKRRMFASHAAESCSRKFSERGLCERRKSSRPTC